MSMKPTSIAYLIKIGKKNHIESLRSDGLIYMNTIKHFKEVEGNEERRDEHEGIDHIEQVTWIKLKSKDGKEIELSKDSDHMKLTSAQLRIFNPELRGNLYSMIAITPALAITTDRFDERNTQFGDHFLLIVEPQTFYDRLAEAINDKGLRHRIGLVQYYEEKTYNGNLSPFHKPNRYEHQNEFRIFVEYDKDEPLSLKIGSLADISLAYPIEEFKGLRFLPKRKGV